MTDLVDEGRGMRTFSYLMVLFGSIIAGVVTHRLSGDAVSGVLVFSAVIAVGAGLLP
jgi:hypothetical protein